MSKVLGLSFGRKMSNTEVMVKHALNACKEAGNEVQFIRVNGTLVGGTIGLILFLLSQLPAVLGH